MDNSPHTKTAITKNGKSGTASALRGAIGGILFFALSILILPLILSKTETPENFIATAAVITVSITSFACAFFANLGGHRFILTGAVCAFAIILVLVVLSLIFGKSAEDKNYLFSAVIYIAAFLFSFGGAKLSMAKKHNKRRRKR